MSDATEETCCRCGEPGPDLRTLWMACFYEMRELPVPFEQKAIRGPVVKAIGETPCCLGDGHPIVDYESMGAALYHGTPANLHRFYTLRVCKRCRADWMGDIAAWFRERPKADRCGSGIFVRRNGATVEISREEWDAMHPGEEPVTVIGR